MKPKFKFILGGDLGTQVISQPEGWAKIRFNLERDLTYWSVIENFEVPLIFYGTAEGKDGGYTYLSNAKANGIDTLVTIDIQVSFDGGITYELCFDGRIDLSTAKETIYRAKIEAAIVRNDLWAMFMAKKSTPIDIFATVDLYGNNRYPINHQELNLPSQKIQSTYSGFNQQFVLYFYGSNWVVNNYLQLDMDTEEISEIKETYNIPNDFNAGIPASKFTMDFDGDYAFNLRIEGSGASGTTRTYGNTYVKWYIQKNSDAAISFTETNYGSGTYKSTVYTYNSTLSLLKSDEIHIYGKIVGDVSGVGPSAFYQVFGYATNDTPSDAGNSFSIKPTKLLVVANTTYQDTNCDSVLLHDAALSICDRILGKDDSFYSEFLGGDKTSLHYAYNGCGYLNTLTRGKNIRGYSFSEKPFTLSFDDWWNGANPIFNLGIGYEELGINSPQSTVIRVETKDKFFDKNPILYLTAINDIQIEFDLNLFTKTIGIGFAQWAAESASGIDDPQTNHTYALRFQLFGKDEKQLSKFITASLAIEQGRRLTKIQNTDWRLDENVFLVAISSQDNQGASPSSVTQQPELVSGASGLLNGDTRYNIRHTPARMLNRWLRFYSGQMQAYPTDTFKFQSGEGNVLMSWGGDGGCDSGVLTENKNISISTNPLFVPIIYSFTHPLTWTDYLTIRNNRKNAISISWINPQKKTQKKTVFIKKLSYDINKSKADFEVWIKK